MSNPRLVLAADDPRLAGAIQSMLKEHVGRPALECRFDFVGDHVHPEGPATLFLAAASAADVESVRRLAHESYWQQWEVDVYVIASAGDWAERELGGLDSYVTGRLCWPEDTEDVVQLARGGIPASTMPDVPESELHERLGCELRQQTPSLVGLAGTLALAAAHDVHVLLTGETGTGKTYFARQIHAHSPRRQQPLSVVACGSLVANLVESELFGHVRGAFTGAERSRVGKLEAVGAGTVLLDEVDTLGLEQQVKLLRVVETGEYEPVGSNRTKTCQARFLFASNVDLDEAVAAGKFRKDLYYRINVLGLHLPPLRERSEDIGPLAELLLARFGRQFHKGSLRLSTPVRAVLESFPWPGNIRQLENVMQHAALVCAGPEVQLQHLPPAMREQEALDERLPHSLADNRHTFERGIIQQALANSNNNRARAASALGISRVTLYKKMKKYGLMDVQRQAV